MENADGWEVTGQEMKGWWMKKILKVKRNYGIRMDKLEVLIEKDGEGRREKGDRKR